MKSDIQLVCFDLGRVLIRICDGWQHACEVAGIGSFGELDAAKAASLNDEVHKQEIGATSLNEFAEAVAISLGLSAVDVKKLSRAYLRGPFPGIEQMLHELHERGIRTACLSNTNADHWEMMLTEGGPNFLPLHQLSYRFASHLIGSRKPNSAIYEFVERETQLAGEKILFFDDAQDNVDGARQRGWNAYRIDPKEDPVVQARLRLRQHGLIN